MTDAQRESRSLVPPALPARTRVGRRWMNLPLRRKAFLIVVLIALVWVPPIGVGLVINGRLVEARDQRRATSANAAELDVLQDSLLGAIAAAGTYLVNLTDAAAVEAYHAAARPIPSQLATLRNDLPTELTPKRATSRGRSTPSWMTRMRCWTSGSGAASPPTCRTIPACTC